jgi:UDP-GlcNAc:undecaprenyl-phosphate/decaprenyl-phosphate GlcNAc-1-phosphate transferase
VITVSIAFILSLVVALALTPVVRSLATRAGAVDRAASTYRKTHARDLPRLGGIAIAVAFYAPLLGLLVVDSEVGRHFLADATRSVGLLLGGVPIIVLGIWDDRFGLGAGPKLLVQFGVALALYGLGFRMEVITTPFGMVELGWLALPLTVAWIVGVINAINLIDGLDGLASGVVFFAAGTTLIFAMANGNTVAALYMACLAGAVLGFLVFNWNPASIFMGDSGSMFLGYVIAVSAIQTHTKGAATVALIAPIVALGLPIMDTLLAMVRRFLRGQRIFEGDREHVHHRLLDLGLSPRQAVLILYTVSIACGMLALAVTYLRGPELTGILAVAVLVTIVGLRYLGYLSSGDAGGAGRRRRNVDTRRRCTEVARRVGRAATVDGAWREVQVLLEVFEANALRLRLSEEGRTMSATRELEGAAGGDGTSWEYILSGGHGTLELRWTEQRTLEAPDHIALEAVAGALAEALERKGGQERPRRSLP